MQILSWVCLEITPKFSGESSFSNNISPDIQANFRSQISGGFYPIVLSPSNFPIISLFCIYIQLSRPPAFPREADRPEPPSAQRQRERPAVLLDPSEPPGGKHPQSPRNGDREWSRWMGLPLTCKLWQQNTISRRGLQIKKLEILNPGVLFMQSLRPKILFFVCEDFGLQHFLWFGWVNLQSSGWFDPSLLVHNDPKASPIPRLFLKFPSLCRNQNPHWTCYNFPALFDCSRVVTTEIFFVNVLS